MAHLKRKHAPEDPTISRKKRATNPKHDQITVKVAKVADDQLPLVLAVPSSIRVPDLSFKAYNKTTPKIPLSKQELLLHTSEHPRLDYIASESFPNDCESLLDHYVGIYDPATGQLELHKARRMKLSCTLRPDQEQLDRMTKQKEYQTVCLIVYPQYQC
jgi:DNA-directed RNA polymerase I subunit RPA49